MTANLEDSSKTAQENFEETGHVDDAPEASSAAENLEEPAPKPVVIHLGRYVHFLNFIFFCGTTIFAGNQISMHNTPNHFLDIDSNLPSYLSVTGR